MKKLRPRNSRIRQFVLAALGAAWVTIGSAGASSSHASPVQIAQALGDALQCAFEPLSDVCIACELRRILPELAPRAGDRNWAFWYLTQLEIRPSGLVPVTSAATRRITDPEYAEAVNAASGLSADQKILMLENLYRAGIEF